MIDNIQVEFYWRLQQTANLIKFAPHWCKRVPGLYNFMSVTCELVYDLQSIGVNADAAGAVARSVIPSCTPALLLGSIPSGNDAAVAFFLRNCILKLAYNNFTNPTSFIPVLRRF